MISAHPHSWFAVCAEREPARDGLNAVREYNGFLVIIYDVSIHHAVVGYV
jgi:hypothetical protein